MTRRDVLVRVLQLHVSSDAREEADRCAMLRLAQELEDPLSRREPRAHFTASAFVGMKTRNAFSPVFSI